MCIYTHAQSAAATDVYTTDQLVSVVTCKPVKSWMQPNKSVIKLLQKIKIEEFICGLGRLDFTQIYTCACFWSSGKLYKSAKM